MKADSKLTSAVLSSYSPNQSPGEQQNNIHSIKQKVFRILKPSVQQLEQNTKSAVNQFFRLRPDPTAAAIMNCSLALDTALAQSYVKDFLARAQEEEMADVGEEEHKSPLSEVVRLMCWMEAEESAELTQSHIDAVCKEVASVLSTITPKELQVLRKTDYGPKFVDLIVGSYHFGTAMKFQEPLMALLASQEKLTEITRTPLVNVVTKQADQLTASQQENAPSFKENVTNTLTNMYRISPKVSEMIVAHPEQLYKEPIIKFIGGLPQQLEVMSLITALPELMVNPIESIQELKSLASNYSFVWAKVTEQIAKQQLTAS